MYIEATSFGKAFYILISMYPMILIKVTTSILLLWFVIAQYCTLVSGLNGTLCCQQYHNETWCSSAVLCSNGESCFHDVFLTDNGTKLHQLGCRSSQQCAGALPVPVGKRGSAKVLCSRCCNKAFCNTPQCQTDPCLLSNPCKYGQCFTDANGQLQCTCDIGYTGTHCDIKEVCHPNPCVHGRCSRSNLGYTCTCNHGFSGNNCDQVDPCANNNLCLHGSCSIDRSGNAQCYCDIGYTGTNCEQKDVCHPNPCLHGICKSSTSGYVCSCNHGYVGINCNIVDACAQSPCLHGKCSMSASGWQCTCDQGFSGRYCDIDIDECSSSPCKHGVCYDHVNGYSCHCFSGYTGKICEIVSAPCSSNPCKNGKCTRKGSGYDCLCNVGYAGKDCDKDIRDCKDALVYKKTSIANNNIYTIKIDTMLENVPCDMVTDGGGWTILMNRESATQDFMLDSTRYATGFGSKTGNYWIGLEDMHKLSSDGRKYQLRIDLTAANGTRYYEVYDDFSIGPRPDFTLYIGNASGTAGDSLRHHNGYGFTTKDVDRDSNSYNCANYLQGAWWFYDCYDSCLTCPYVANKPQTQQCRSMSWNTVAYCEPLKAAKMMIRPM